ncbi:MAG: hypothetical protein DRO73_08440 [Candidatus Thorarchaeota archaeon]|nr:MAG: hypothetical protein DRO73_08440 [Candidatus Thorarchaeota archaeon]
MRQEMTEETIEREDEATEIDVSSLLRGTATVAFVAQLVSGIGIVGSLIVYAISRPGGLVESIDLDVAIFLLMLGAMLTLFLFLGAIGFFVRVNRRLGRFVMSENLESVDLSRPGAKPVVVLYGMAVGLILIMGMYGYWLVYKYYLAAIASTALSFFAFSISLAVFVLAFLVEVVLVAIGRTASGMVKKILALED